MSEHLGLMEILGIAGSVSLLSGWRLYLTVLATGLAMHFHVLPLPEHLQSLQALANPWVMGAAGLAAFMEFFADNALEHERCGEMIERIGLVNFLEGVELEVDPCMVSNPRTNPYVRTDGWDDEVAKINAKKQVA